MQYLYDYYHLYFVSISYQTSFLKSIIIAYQDMYFYKYSNSLLYPYSLLSYRRYEFYSILHIPYSHIYDMYSKKLQFYPKHYCNSYSIFFENLLRNPWFSISFLYIVLLRDESWNHWYIRVFLLLVDFFLKKRQKKSTKHLFYKNRTL